MESIDRLREYVNGTTISTWTRNYIDQHIDAIEREVDDMVPLPVDADGVPIHVGDVMEWDNGNVEKVESLHNYGSEGWSVTTAHNATVIPWSARHHHAPTVEDVLEEFVARWMETHHDDIPALKAEFAAKLRLAGDE